MNPFVDRKKSTVNGSSLSYLESGPKDGPLALLIHGIPANAELWRGVMELLSNEGWHCLAPDLPGYGETELPPDGDYSIKGAANLLANWIKEERMEDIWLIGHDIGGGVAQILITDIEEKFNKFTLSNSITSDSWPVPGIEALIKLAKLKLFTPIASTGIWSTSIGRSTLQNAVSDKRHLTKSVVSRIFWDKKVSTKNGRTKFQRMLGQLNPQHTIEIMPALKKVQVPVSLVWGLKDPNQPWDGPGKILRETFPSAKIKTLPNSGHFLQVDSTKEYATALLET
ncbi:alpha/beta fold hydrolase [Mechercharimyces sp. CAU 1602]|uniref:alpha/beta fold hydrolase n=1 Tax=Mechercharimyces sp. CAU 1602 TaxID=2973933 RepID=UPI0021620F19|nr:alpha/beta hydrolase [Mechercharimyces sp. CAU 1602]MCS1350556.1 alpha/beta hydrolase [Mechercharimyces sp. CAU 1602]